MTDTNDSKDWGEEMDRPEHEQTYEAFLDYTNGASSSLPLFWSCFCSLCMAKALFWHTAVN